MGLPAPAAPGALSALDGLLADFAEAQAMVEVTELDVPRKPGLTVRYVTDIPYEMVQAWRKASYDAVLDVFNEVEQHLAMLVFACQAICVEGEPITDAGQPVTFTSPALQARFGADDDPAAAVKALYGKDPFVVAAGRALLLEAGYGEEVHPTKR